MKIQPSTRSMPVSRDVMDPRSTSTPAPKVRKTLLNDRRSTR